MFLEAQNVESSPLQRIFQKGRVSQKFINKLN